MDGSPSVSAGAMGPSESPSDGSGKEASGSESSVEAHSEASESKALLSRRGSAGPAADPAHTQRGHCHPLRRPTIVKREWLTPFLNFEQP